MLSDYAPLLIFLAAVVVFGAIALFLPAYLAGSRHSAAKDLPYECGIVPRSTARRRFSVSFYLTAMLFIIFDVEAIFIYPWAVILHGLRWFGIAEMAVFVAILLVALAYVWRKGALDWGS
ncbi:MAG TPA: NADH-quinone oxidoreductase subunit A [Candidatus Limnocylindrales bacterium]|nr:NADH-quinone oxidoreductase subunit A [Candidatus Limnocylindrales bacterium]